MISQDCHASSLTDAHIAYGAVYDETMFELFKIAAYSIMQLVQLITIFFFNPLVI